MELFQPDSAMNSPKEVSFECMLTTKSGQLCNFELEITESELLIVSQASQKVKSRVTLAKLHIKKAPKLSRSTNLLDNETTANTP